jgi:hypothetical protein
MKKHIIIIILAITALLLMAGCKKKESVSPGSIYGTITDFATGEPVKNANVKLRQTGATTLTGSDGMYEFLNVPTGNYNINVSKAEYNDLIDDYVIVVNSGDRVKRDVQIEKLPSVLRIVNSDVEDISDLPFGAENDVTSRTFSIFNDSPRKIIWWIEENCSWITEVKSMLNHDSSGELEAGRQEPIKVTIDRDALGLGIKSYILNINSDNGSKELLITAGADVGLPSLTTDPVSNLTQYSVTFNGTVINEGTPIYTERGFVYSTSPQPTISNNIGKIESEINGHPTFSENINNLTPNSTYYVSAYAINPVGEAYGDYVTFTTSAGIIKVTTNEVTDIASTSATCGGTLSLENGNTLPVTARGVCWSTNHNPTTANNHTNDGSGIGSYISYITDLTINTNYYVRAYATNELGTYYGEEKNFNTTQGLASVTTKNVVDIHLYDAAGGGIVTSDNGFAVTSRGICWSLVQNPTIDDNHTTNGSGVGEFNSYIDNLQNATTYHVRAYAINENGIAYGEDRSFTTNSGEITVTTNTVTSIGPETATCGGNATVTNGNNLPITAKGVCWSTNHNPTIDDYHTEDGTGTGQFVSSISGLSLNTTYYVRAYATNQIDTYYGDEVHFATTNGLPTVTTINPTLNDITVTSGGNITSDGGYPVLERGICYSTAPNPDLSPSHNHTSDGSGTGTFSSTFTMSNVGKYYIRAYATNSVGTYYGEQKEINHPYYGLQTFSLNGHTYRIAPIAPTTMNWNDANNYCETLTLYGYSDWRLPTGIEIEEAYNQFFTGFEELWSSNECYYSRYTGHSVYWKLGFSAAEGCREDNNLYYVRPVRVEN